MQHAFLCTGERAAVVLRAGNDFAVFDNVPKGVDSDKGCNTDAVLRCFRP